MFSRKKPSSPKHESKSCTRNQGNRTSVEFAIDFAIHSFRIASNRWDVLLLFPLDTVWTSTNVMSSVFSSTSMMISDKNIFSPFHNSRVSEAQNDGILINRNPQNDTLFQPLAPFSHYFDEERHELRPAAQELVDLVVMGFPKTGTTFLDHKLIGSHPDVCMPWNEVVLDSYETAELLYNQKKIRFEDNQKINVHKTIPDHIAYGDCVLRGYKAPAQIWSKSRRDEFYNFFPKSKLIVGVRHPVTWYQSYYNFQHRKQGSLPPPGTLIGTNCVHGVCTANANFHVFLSYLGKTGMVSKEEQHLLNSTSSMTWSQDEVANFPQGLPNKVFIYETTQMNGEEHPELFQSFRLDLTSFLGLENNVPLSFKGKSGPESHHKHTPPPFAICDPEHDALRAELVSIGAAAADWILRYFLPLEDVTVSSPNEFKRLLLTWKEDPCAVAK